MKDPVTYWVFRTFNFAIDSIAFVEESMRNLARPYFGRLVFVAVVLGVIFGVACCTPSAISEYTVSPARYPFSRPSMITKVVTLHSDFDHDVLYEVYCPGDILDGHSTYTFKVPPHSERRFLVNMMSPHQYDQVCVIDSINFPGH